MHKELLLHYLNICSIVKGMMGIVQTAFPNRQAFSSGLLN
jgi:hypothetical protein